MAFVKRKKHSLERNTTIAQVLLEKYTQSPDRKAENYIPIQKQETQLHCGERVGKKSKFSSFLLNL